MGAVVWVGVPWVDPAGLTRTTTNARSGCLLCRLSAGGGDSLVLGPSSSVGQAGLVRVVAAAEQVVLRVDLRKPRGRPGSRVGEGGSACGGARTMVLLWPLARECFWNE